jgi:hypothetical protein
VFSVLLCCNADYSTLGSSLGWNIMFVILCVVYCFECVYVILCIVVPLPPGTYQLAVNNNNNNNNNNNSELRKLCAQPHGVIYKVVQIWPGQTVTCLHTNRPGHIWTTLYKKHRNVVKLRVYGTSQLVPFPWPRESNQRQLALFLRSTLVFSAHLV